MSRLTSPRSWARLVREVALTLGAIAGVLCLLSAVAAVAFDVKPVVFRSGSMSPSIETGALAFSRTVDASDLEVGEVVTVPLGTGDMVTHRIQEVSLVDGSANLVLKGDANMNPDDRVYVVESAPRILFDVPRAGYVVAFATGPVGVFGSGIVVALVLVGIARSWNGPRRPDDHDDAHRAGVHRHLGVASATAVTAVAVAAGVSGTSSTLAYYEDSAAATSQTFAAAALPASAGCSTSSGSIAVQLPSVAGASGYTLAVEKAGGGTLPTVEVGGAGVAVFDALDLGPGYYAMWASARNADGDAGQSQQIGTFSVVEARTVRNVGTLECTDVVLSLPAPVMSVPEGPQPTPETDPVPAPVETAPVAEPTPEP